eukprot:jgi/Tetstr1/463307/TSEL_008231.t1
MLAAVSLGRSLGGRQQAPAGSLAGSTRSARRGCPGLGLPSPRAVRLHCAPAAASAVDGDQAAARYAVVGGGFAGLATCWHLLASARHDAPVAVDLYDCVGLGAGGSGAAAGLLHPYTSRGKLLWKGAEGVEAALELVAAAEQHAEPGTPGFVWRSGLLRPAKSSKQAADFLKFCGDAHPGGNWGGARAVDAAAARALVPGLSLAELAADQVGTESSATLPPDSPAGLHVPDGLVLHSKRYLSALWRACEAAAEAAGPGSEARFHTARIRSPADLTQDADGAPYSAVVVAAGAAIGTIQGLGEVEPPLHLSQGYTLDLRPQAGRPPFPASSPSLLGGVYMSVQEDGGAAVVGATRQYGFSAEQSFRELGREVTDEAEARGAVEELLPAAASSWPEISSAWEVTSVRTGVRALPPRTPYGSIPLAGRVQGGKGDGPHQPPCWVLVGLGARGLVYHALLGKWLAAAVRVDDPMLLPRQVRSWQTDNAPAPPNVDY